MLLFGGVLLLRRWCGGFGCGSRRRKGDRGCLVPEGLGMGGGWWLADCGRGWGRVVGGLVF